MPKPRADSAARPRARSGTRHDHAREIVARLAAAYPGATTELNYRTPFELLVATILSAQSTDARVNVVTPVLFDRYPDAPALAAAPLPEIERLVQATGFFRMKARAIVGMAAALVSQHGGEVPASMEALVALPGVGRKTANVVLGHALGVPGLPVDRHVLRVAGRLGMAKATTPERVEVELTAVIPSAMWTLASDCLILHGRRVCRPRPLCARCMVSQHCMFFRRTGGLVPAPTARPRARRAPSAGAAVATSRNAAGARGRTRAAAPKRKRP